ncbi:hypothetical protein ACFWOY_33470 [Streptomyces sp. NPDC058423]|uniref:hypothetical protein n=1 Tax=unclassified Streptomyces TaxID=2593676 RepID=UPI00365DD072
MSRTIRSSRTKTAMLVSAGTVAALLSVVPSTAAAADTLPASTAGLPGSSALVMSFDDDDRRGERGERGERGPQGPPGPQGPEGELDTYVVTGLVATSDVIGTDVTSTALCLGNDIAIGGGYDTSDLDAIEVEDSVPVFVGTGPATGWRAVAEIVAAGGSITAYAVCHDVE